ncbi:MAG TPA: hypothetical protein VK116_19875 [Planctomycetota bacterium]|nr:hypothetical protein [Planctomycetota bacterium]
MSAGTPSRARSRTSRREALALATRAIRERGISLLEVLLAISIAAMILLGVLNFYLTSAQLRDDIEARLDALAEARLILDEIATDLATAASDPDWGPGVIGRPTSIEILKTGFPRVRSSTSTDANETAQALVTADRRRVRWRLLGVEPQVEIEAEPKAPDGAAGELDAPVPVEGEPPAEEAPPPAVGLTDLAALEGNGLERQELLLPSAIEPLEGRELLTARVSDHLRYFALRYFDGSVWSESWSAEDLPLAVEIRLAREAPEAAILPSESEVTSEPQAESTPTGDVVFRRIVRLPGAGRFAPAPVDNAASESGSIDTLGAGGTP